MDSIAVTRPHMAVLSQGRLPLTPFGALAQAFAEEVLARAELEERLAAPGEITMTAETDAQRARTLVEALPGVAGITVRADGPDRSQLAVASGTEDIYALSRSIFQSFADSGCALCELGVKKPSLEDIFLELTEGGETP